MIVCKVTICKAKNSFKKIIDLKKSTQYRVQIQIKQEISLNNERPRLNENYLLKCIYGLISFNNTLLVIVYFCHLLNSN